MTKQQRVARLATAGALACILAACSGGGTGTQSALPSSPGQGQSLANVQVRIVDTTSGASQTASGKKRPMYISPSTNASSLQVTPTGGSSQTIVTNLSSGSPNCTTATPRVCTIPMQLTAGTYTFALKTYDEAPVSGSIPAGANQLAQASTTATIQLNTTNTINFALSGIVVGSPGVSCTSSCGALSYMSLPANGTTQTFAFAVSATDADGNVITGSNPYSSPITVTLTETGGSGNSALIYNGTNVGATATLVKPTDTLALQYNGGGASGYSTTTNIGGTGVVISPMYVTPASVSEGKVTDSHTGSITEASAPNSIAYSASATSCSEITASSASGSGSSGAFSFSTSAAGGTNANCTVAVSDILGTTVSVPVAFAIPGPIGGGGGSGGGTVTFPSGGSGSCSAGIAFTATGQTALFTITDPGYSGSFTQVNTTPATATASISGANVTITAVAAGTTSITFSDSAGNTIPCSIGVTTTSGTVS